MGSSSSKSSKMSKPKLTYFGVRARGELTRLVLAAAKKDFEDNRIDFEAWGKMKETSFYGSLPVVDIGGKEFFQGNAIATYFARENGLYGENNLHGLMIEQVVGLKEDTLQEEAKMMFGSEEDKAAAAKKVVDTTYPRTLKIWEDCIKRNEAKSGYLVGKKLSLGDIAIFEGTTTITQNHPKLLDGYPLIKALREKVAAADGIKQYLAKRQQTPI